ncbi:MAG: MBL fold metallo-hydrolase [candidate division Zixibacteria bacterium]|nr:MBL fold metallo-hydrolase [candidate division Zixibacteria bacterium]
MTETAYFLDQIVVGPLQVNCYLFGCTATGEVIVVDPGDEAERIRGAVAECRARVTAIVLTHGHYDHLGAVKEIKETYSCQIMIHEAEAQTLVDPQENLSIFSGDSIICPAADRLLKEGDTITVGKLSLEVLHVPGHSPGSICLKYENLLIAGDLLFLTSIGRTDLPGGSFPKLEESIQTKIYTLPDDTLIFPGHGDKTTVGFEKRHNQFVRASC